MAATTTDADEFAELAAAAEAVAHEELRAAFDDDQAQVFLQRQATGLLDDLKDIERTDLYILNICFD